MMRVLNDYAQQEVPLEEYEKLRRTVDMLEAWLRKKEQFFSTHPYTLNFDVGRDGCVILRGFLVQRPARDSLIEARIKSMKTYLLDWTPEEIAQYAREHVGHNV